MTTESNQLKPEIVLIKADDWEGLYVNGQLEEENHILYAQDILKVLAQLGLIDYLSKSCDATWLEDEGELPEQLSEVKLKE